MTEGRRGRTLILDTSVAVKFYLPEELRDEALLLLSQMEAGEARPLAPSTVQPEFFNALWQQCRRGVLTVEEVGEFWAQFSDIPYDLYAPENLMPRAAGITQETGVIIYDALFVALAEAEETILVTADDRLLKSLENTDYDVLGASLREVKDLLPASGTT